MPDTAAAVLTEAQPSQNATRARASAGAGGGIALGNDVEINPAKPLPHLSSFGAEAFEAQDRRAVGEQYALLCGRSYIPRTTQTASYKNLKNPHLVRLLDAGIVQWAPENRQRFALVFDRPAGRKILQSPEAAPLRIAEDRLSAAILQPALSVLMDFVNVDMVHGAINLENMFLTGAEGSETLMLGECISSAPSARQHAIYETIERGMAQPMGRGPGTIKDDLYAFGVCVAMMIRGENLMHGKTEKQILQEKLEYGSYGLIVGRDRLPAGISEFLRGVLNDDEQQRWGIDDAMKWLEGRRLSPKQPRMPLKAARPFIFQERKYWDLRSIAMAFANNINEAGSAIEKDQFDLWIKRNFEDKQLEGRLEKVWEREKAAGREKLVSSVSMVLDPHAPVRYKRLSVLPMGYGSALAEAMAKEQDIQIYAELILQQILNFWINMRFEEIPDASNMIANFEKCRNFLTQKMPGYGIERVVYMLNKEAFCMSPLLKDFIVVSVGGLVLALEALARRGEKTDKVFDRHMIAFISVREPKMIDPNLGHLISHDRANQLLGITRTLAAIQKRFATGPLPALSAMLVSMMEPAFNRFVDRDLRQELVKRMDKHKDSGNLALILELIDDPRILNDDINRYMQARAEFASLTQERLNMAAALKGRKDFGYATGRQVAMAVSSILGAIGLISYIATQFMGKM